MPKTLGLTDRFDVVLTKVLIPATTQRPPDALIARATLAQEARTARVAGGEAGLHGVAEPRPTHEVVGTRPVEVEHEDALDAKGILAESVRRVASDALDVGPRADRDTDVAVSAGAIADKGQDSARIDIAAMEGIDGDTRRHVLGQDQDCEVVARMLRVEVP